LINQAITAALDQGLTRYRHQVGRHTARVGPKEMGDAIIGEMERLAA
jgi:hypothetical protein